MFEIRNLSGQLAELYPDTSISFEKYNTIFNDDDKLFEDITYSFNLPFTELNKIFFSNGHLVESKKELYRIAVQCIVDGHPFYAGHLSFSIVKGEYRALLQVNFGSLATQVKKDRMCEIFTDDALPGQITAAHMKDTCVNPKNYSHAFFPVYNDEWDPEKTTTYFLVNNWDHAAQAFVNRGMQNRDKTATSPYFKLKYLLVKVAEYLGFKASGSWIDNLESDKIYVYTRYAPYLYLFGSFAYLPRKLTIADFLKIVKQRFKLSFTFNIFSGSVIIEEVNSILTKNEVFDVSGYVESIEEISVVQQESGYTVTLQPDSKDDMFLDTVNVKEKVYLPTQRLIIGNGEKEIELDSSTLKSKVIGDYSMPQTKQMLWVSQYAGEDDFQLKFLYFPGMKSVSGGKIFPEAKPMELSEADAMLYRILNDAKEIKINISAPSEVLRQIDGSKLIGFISNEGSSNIGIFESLKFSLDSSGSELVPATLQVRTKSISFDTAFSIEKVQAATSEDIASPKFKAFFDINTSGLSEVEYELYYPQGRISDGAYAAMTSTGKIKKSTDSNGGGGETSYLPVVDYAHATAQDVELRIRKGNPKYAVQNGIKRNFLQASGYYYLKSSTFGNGFKSIDAMPVWIVF